ITKARTTLLRDQGAVLSPFNAFMFIQGLETLSLRVERHIENALKVVKFLSESKKFKKVNHPSLPDHPDHALYTKYFSERGAGVIFTAEYDGTQEETLAFIDRLKLFSLLANVADLKSLVIHPATTTHSQLSGDALLATGITPSTIRFSIGTEHIDDILFDISSAL
ncbi:MAG: PLP-dependent transferase, partial [Oscillospiraceae bacterium]|nr:PLP-dependent transferase [Oscillospiraceae bacterium]